MLLTCSFDFICVRQWSSLEVGYLCYKQGSYEGIWRNFLDGAQLLVYLFFILWYARTRLDVQILLLYLSRLFLVSRDTI